VHLVWAPLGPQALERFISAYRQHDPGVRHRLVVLLNGFGSAQSLEPWLALLDGIEHEQLRLPEPLLDVAAYRLATAQAGAERYCFMNSYSEPTTAGWLSKLDEALAAPGVGLAGATGSWASTRSWTAHLLRLPSAYRGVLPPPAEAIAQFMAVEADRPGGPTPPAPRSALATARARLATLAEVPGQTIPFERFPAYHLRTNAFAIRAHTLAGLRVREVREKRDAYLVENGRNSITRQVQRQGLRTVVVDRDGEIYDRERWAESRTFWQGDQERLLVRDNQTRTYAEADDDRRRLLSGFAWGHAANPAIP